MPSSTVPPDQPWNLTLDYKSKDYLMHLLYLLYAISIHKVPKLNYSHDPKLIVLTLKIVKI